MIYFNNVERSRLDNGAKTLREKNCAPFHFWIDVEKESSWEYITDIFSIYYVLWKVLISLHICICKNGFGVFLDILYWCCSMLYLDSLGMSEYVSSRGIARLFYLHKVLLYIIYLSFWELYFHKCWSYKALRNLSIL